LTVVLIASVASGIGLGILGLREHGLPWFLLGVLAGAAAGAVGWLLWAYITYYIGTRLFKGPKTSATYGELLRTLGFSQSPGVLRVVYFVPILGAIVALATGIWMLIAGVIAVRQALDFTTARAIGTVIVGWIPYSIIVGVVMTLAW
jgi:hypothetical protein